MCGPSVGGGRPDCRLSRAARADQGGGGEGRRDGRLCYNPCRRPQAPREDSPMLLLGRQRQRTCDGWTRRAFLQVGGSTVLGLSLADLLRLRAEGGVTGGASAK